MKVLHDRVLVRRIEEEEKTKGGIVIPSDARQKPQEGIVIAVGSGKVLESGGVRSPEVEVDDKILFEKYAGSEIEIEGVEYLIIREDDILGIL